MIKVIAFDYGGVLGTDADAWTTTFKKVLEVSGLTNSEMLKIWEKHWPKLKIGKEEIINYWADAAKKKDINPEILRNIYNESITIDSKMLNLAKSMKNKHKLIILSNDTVDWMDAKKEKFNLLNIFEKIYCSGNMGIAKPNKEIFEYVLKDLNIKPGELLFIDNQENNIEAANSLGIKTILFVDEISFKNKIKLFS
jgi:glucose-1-phosphatase